MRAAEATKPLNQEAAVGSTEETILAADMLVEVAAADVVVVAADVVAVEAVVVEQEKRSGLAVCLRPTPHQHHDGLQSTARRRAVSARARAVRSQ